MSSEDEVLPKKTAPHIFIVAAHVLVSFQLSLSVSMSMMGRYWGAAEILGPFFFFLFLTGLLFFIFKFFRIKPEAACFASLFSTFTLAQYVGLLTPHINDITLVLFMAGVGLGSWWICRKPNVLKVALLTLVVHAGIFSALQSFKLAQFYCCQRYDLTSLPPKKDILAEAKMPVVDQAPDIYVVIQDAMGDFSTTQRLFGHDSQNFSNFLKKSGVFVAEGSRSYYTQTFQSVSSTMNMNYFQDDVSLPHNDFYDYRPATAYFLRPRLTEFLREQGYEFHISSTGYNLNALGLEGVSDLRAPLFKMSAIGTIQTSSIYYPLLNMLFGEKRQFLNPYRDHYHDIKGQYQFLRDMAESSSSKPRFIYAHIMIPHPPFVFAADGGFADYNYFDIFSYNDGVFHPRSDLYEEGWPAFYKKAYAQQLAYSQDEIVSFIKTLQKGKHNRPFVVLIQGDHGSRSLEDFGDLEKSDKTELFGVTNIVYFSDQNYGALHRSLSPLNTLRVVMNKYFSANLDMLPDQHWYSTWMKPFELLPVSPEEMEVQP